MKLEKGQLSTNKTIQNSTTWNELVRDRGCACAEHVIKIRGHCDLYIDKYMPVRVCVLLQYSVKRFNSNRDNEINIQTEPHGPTGVNAQGPVSPVGSGEVF